MCVLGFEDVVLVCYVEIRFLGISLLSSVLSSGILLLVMFIWLFWC